MPCISSDAAAGGGPPRCAPRQVAGRSESAVAALHNQSPGPNEFGDGSIIIVVATDAPLLPHQLKRIAKRASLGIGRMGGTASNGSDALVAARTLSGANGFTVNALPHDRLREVLKKYNRLR